MFSIHCANMTKRQIQPMNSTLLETSFVYSLSSLQSIFLCFIGMVVGSPNCKADFLVGKKLFWNLPIEELQCTDWTNSCDVIGYVLKINFNTNFNKHAIMHLRDLLGAFHPSCCLSNEIFLFRNFILQYFFFGISFCFFKFEAALPKNWYT